MKRNIYILTITILATFFISSCLLKKQEPLFNYKDWQEIKLSNFQLNLPSDMKFVEKFGVENEGWAYRNDDMVLQVTFGTNISDFNNLRESFKTELNYTEEKLDVNGRVGYYFTFLTNEDNNKPFYSGIYFDDMRKPNKLYLRLSSNSAESFRISKNIFQSIKLN